MELVVYPDKISDASMERLLSVLCNSDVMIYVADAESVNSTDKVFFHWTVIACELQYTALVK